MEKVRRQISRNEYFKLLTMAHGRLPANIEYDIIPIDFTDYGALFDATKRMVDGSFTRETEDKHGDYMLCGHWIENWTYQFVDKCKLHVHYVDGYSAYAYSDDQLALFTFCEGDVYFNPYKDKKTYVKRKKEMIDFYKEAY